jgi:hypothetical protein
MPAAPLLAVAAALALLSGCSTSRLAVGAMVPILDNARDTAMASDDVRTFRDGAAANLFLLEGLIATDPGRKELQLDAAMMYFSYAFAFIEDDDPGYASILYRKGFEHGRAAMLANKKVIREFDAPFDEFAASLSSLRRKDAPAALWTAANWSQFIALHLDSTAVLRDIPKVTRLLERVAELDGDYFSGLVHVMIGSLHSFRPPLAGGSPEKSLESFERAFATGGDSFLLPRYFFARYYCYRIQDADLFRSSLQQVMATEPAADDPYRMLNLIARDKARTLLGEIDDLF